MDEMKYNPKGIISGFRKASGYQTADEVAKVLGISKPTYLKYEKDPSKMTLEILDKLEELFGEEFRDMFFKHKLYKKNR